MLLEIMNGIEVLSKSEIKSINISAFLIILLASILIISAGAYIYASIFDINENLLYTGVVLIILLSVFMALKTSTTGEYEYKVTISDEVSMNEFMKKYEIINQEGKIYTIKER